MLYYLNSEIDFAVEEHELSERLDVGFIKNEDGIYIIGILMGSMQLVWRILKEKNIILQQTDAWRLVTEK